MLSSLCTTRLIRSNVEIVQGRPDLTHDDFSGQQDEALLKQLQREILLAEYDLAALYGPAKECIASLSPKDQATLAGQSFMWLLTSASHTTSFILSLLTMRHLPAATTRLEYMLSEAAHAVYASSQLILERYRAYEVLLGEA